MKDRRFGIEIECNIRGATRKAKEVLRDAGFKKWADSASGEGSLPAATGVEIRSPILKGKDGFEELKDVYKVLNEAGFWMTRSCGMHIHHDAPEFNRGENIELVRRLFLSWVKNQGVISPMVDKYRRGQNHYCKPYGQYEANHLDQYMKNGRHVHWNKTQALNLSSLRRHGTIEIRQHEGTTSYDQAEAWIKFGQRFINHVVNLKSPMREAEDTAELLRRIKAPVKVQGLYSEKAKGLYSKKKLVAA